MFIRVMTLQERMRIRERELKRRNSMAYLCLRVDRAQEFVDTVRAMLKKSDLTLTYQSGAYRASLTVPYDDDAYGCRTFGCIIGKHFLLDCDLVYEKMEKEEKALGPSKQEYFSNLLQAGVLTLCRHPLRYMWFRRHEDIELQKNHKFFCISNDVLKMKLEDFSDVIQND